MKDLVKFCKNNTNEKRNEAKKQRKNRVKFSMGLLIAFFVVYFYLVSG
jgi:hypothetical protein